MTIARTILLRLGLLVVVLGVLIALAVPFSSLDGNAERTSCGTVLIRSDDANPLVDPILHDDCAYAAGPYRLTALVVGGVGVVLAVAGLLLPRPPAPQPPPPTQRTTPAWARDDEDAQG